MRRIESGSQFILFEPKKILDFICRHKWSPMPAFLSFLNVVSLSSTSIISCESFFPKHG